MAGHKSNTETEIKLSVASAEEGRRLLEAHGFQISKPRIFERNVIFDTDQAVLRSRHCVLRVRSTSEECVLTFKGPSERDSIYKTREEVETAVQDDKAVFLILAGLGFHPVFIYEKFRTEYLDPAARDGVATLDETPIGSYFELEGPPAWIDQTAQRLGFTEDHYITSSYGRLYMDRCKLEGSIPSSLTFEQG